MGNTRKTMADKIRKFDLAPRMDFGGRLDKISTPKMAAIRFHYKAAGLDQWDNAKVRELSRLMRCSVRELCAWAGQFEPSMISIYARNNHWPMTLTVQWNRLLQFKLGQFGLQDAMAAKTFKLANEPRNEEEKAA
jgi:hypothetical protein